jgi:carbon-monoxide dehydrogenase large subunit
MLDIAAHELKIDRVELRRRNLIKRDQLPYRNPFGLTYDSGTFEANMDRALALSGWAAFEARRQQSAARGKLRGIGVANYIEAPVGAPRERIEMTVLPDGVVDIVSGTLAHGQGHETTFAQVVSAQLGVPVEAVRLRTGDTDFVQVGGGTHSDRSLRLAGTLLVQASEEIIEAARATACAMLGAQQVHFVQGGYVDNTSSAGVSLFEVARHMAAHGIPGDPTTKALASAKEFAGRLPAYPTGAAICELEIDPQTGEVNIVDYTSVDDVGQPVNPLIVEGQVHGGLAQGIGQALSEGYYIDTSGQVLSGSYMDYGVPRASAMPPLQLELVEDPTYGNPLRVKGGGESGITPATAAIFNALADALAGNGNTDELDMPATPAVIWRYIHEPRASQQFAQHGD